MTNQNEHKAKYMVTVKMKWILHGFVVNAEVDTHSYSPPPDIIMKTAITKHFS